MHRIYGAYGWAIRLSMILKWKHLPKELRERAVNHFLRFLSTLSRTFLSLLASNLANLISWAIIKALPLFGCFTLLPFCCKFDFGICFFFFCLDEAPGRLAGFLIPIFAEARKFLVVGHTRVAWAKKIDAGRWTHASAQGRRRKKLQSLRAI